MDLVYPSIVLWELIAKYLDKTIVKHNAKDAGSLARVVSNDGRKLVLDDIKDLWAGSAIEI